MKDRGEKTTQWRDDHIITINFKLEAVHKQQLVQLQIQSSRHNPIFSVSLAAPDPSFSYSGQLLVCSVCSDTDSEMTVSSVSGMAVRAAAVEGGSES